MVAYEQKEVTSKSDLVSNFNTNDIKSVSTSYDSSREIKEALNTLITSIKEALEPDINNDFIEEAMGCGLLSKTECKGVPNASKQAFLCYFAEKDPENFQKYVKMNPVKFSDTYVEIDVANDQLYQIDHMAWAKVPDQLNKGQSFLNSRTSYPPRTQSSAELIAELDEEKTKLSKELSEKKSIISQKYRELEKSGLFKKYYDKGMSDREITRLVESRLSQVLLNRMRFGDFSVGQTDYPGVYDPIGEIVKRYRKKPIMPIIDKDIVVIKDYLMRSFNSSLSETIKQLTLSLVQIDLIDNAEDRHSYIKNNVARLIQANHDELTMKITSCEVNGTDYSEEYREMFLVDRFSFYRDVYYPEITDDRVSILNDMINCNTTRIRMMEHFDTVDDIDSKIDDVYGEQLAKHAKKVYKEFSKWFPAKSGTEKVVISFMELMILIPWLHTAKIKKGSNAEIYAFDDFVSIFSKYRMRLPKQWNYDFADTLFGMISVLRDVDDLYTESGVYEDLWENSIPTFWSNVTEKYSNNQLFAKIAKALNS